MRACGAHDLVQSSSPMHSGMHTGGGQKHVHRYLVTELTLAYGASRGVRTNTCTWVCLLRCAPWTHVQRSAARSISSPRRSLPSLGTFSHSSDPGLSGRTQDSCKKGEIQREDRRELGGGVHGGGSHGRSHFPHKRRRNHNVSTPRTENLQVRARALRALISAVVIKRAWWS